MKAVVIDRPHDVAYREVDSPVCGPDDVLVRSHKAGVCRTDLEVLDVIAFLFVGRFNSTRRMLPERSVTISSIVCFLYPPDEVLCAQGSVDCGPRVRYFSRSVIRFMRESARFHSVRASSCRPRLNALSAHPEYARPKFASISVAFR